MIKSVCHTIFCNWSLQTDYTNLYRPVSRLLPKSILSFMDPFWIQGSCVAKPKPVKDHVLHYFNCCVAKSQDVSDHFYITFTVCRKAWTGSNQKPNSDTLLCICLIKNLEYFLQILSGHLWKKYLEYVWACTGMAENNN